MASFQQATRDDETDVCDGALPSVEWLTAEEARALFDERSHEITGMSGDEFVRRWEAGEIEANDRSGLMALVLMIPVSQRAEGQPTATRDYVNGVQRIVSIVAHGNLSSQVISSVILSSSQLSVALNRGERVQLRADVLMEIMVVQQV